MCGLEVEFDRECGDDIESGDMVCECDCEYERLDEEDDVEGAGECDPESTSLSRTWVQSNKKKKLEEVEKMDEQFYYDP